MEILMQVETSFTCPFQSYVWIANGTLFCMPVEAVHWSWILFMPFCVPISFTWCIMSLFHCWHTLHYMPSKEKNEKKKIPKQSRKNCTDFIFGSPKPRMRAHLIVAFSILCCSSHCHSSIPVCKIVSVLFLCWAYRLNFNQFIHRSAPRPPRIVNFEINRGAIIILLLLYRVIVRTADSTRLFMLCVSITFCI